MTTQPKKSSSVGSSSALIIGGNDDLLTELLLFVPAKPLIRFQLVSKQWRSLISSPSFHYLHTLRRRRSKTHHPSFLLRTTTDSQFLICHPADKSLFPIRFKSPVVKILQSCNGLLLLETRNYSNGPRHFEIFNPTTMQSRQLQPPKAFVGLSLVFDPSKSPHYRVVCFISLEPISTRLLTVYDSETHTWRDGFKSNTGRNNFWSGVYWNGGIYFIKYHQKSQCLSPDDGNVFAFDKPPRIHTPGSQKYHVVESNGHLHCILLFCGLDYKCLYIYELSGVDFSWSTMYRVDLGPILGTFGGNIWRDVRLIGMIRGDDDEGEEDSSILILFLHMAAAAGKIIIYRFSTEVFEVLVDNISSSSSEGYYFKEFEFEDAHQFIQSLAPV